MKKLLYILIFLSVSFPVAAKIFRVGAAYPNTSIQGALRAAVNGDTIIVSAGRYYEKNIVVNKSVVLIGINYPVLDGQYLYEIISIKANGVIVEGFKIIHSGVSSMEDIAGIKIYNARDVIIRSNILEDTFFGIYTQSGTNCKIENNSITAYKLQEQQSGNGIHCWQCDSMLVIANTISGHRDGIYFEFVTNAVIWRNISVKNIRYGLHFMFSHNDAYICNIFENNGAGVSVMFSHGVKMFNNYFKDNSGDGSYGILLKEISDSYINNNYFEKNTIAIYAEGATRISMEKNLFIKNGWALKIQASCMEVNLFNNNFINNTFDVATNGSLVLNKFDHNYWDKYEGYDLNKDLVGDIPYRPVSMYSMIVENNPPAMMLFRSFMTTLLDKTEKILPSLTPENLKDDHPLMKRLSL